MFAVNGDMSIHVTRGDAVVFFVTADDDNGLRKFQVDDVIRVTVYGKKACEKVVLKKDFAVDEETDCVLLCLTGSETKIGEVISKPVDYWYDVKLNPDTNPQTLVGYDEGGAKVFRLFPEGNDVG